MRILIDGDACPVIELTEEIAEKYNIPLLVYSDINHNISLNYGELIQVDCENQSVDMKILNECGHCDIVITQDYGLAAVVLGRGGTAVNHSGKVYNEKNIKYLLMKRHVHAKIRKAGGRTSSPKKRTEQNDQDYREKLIELIIDLKDIE